MEMEFAVPRNVDTLFTSSVGENLCVTDVTPSIYNGSRLSGERLTRLNSKLGSD